MPIILIIIVFSVLTACVSIDRIENNFEAEGYEYYDDASEYIGATLQSLEEDDATVETHVFVNGLDIAVVLEFDSRSEMNNQIENNESLQEWLSEDDNSELTRSNYLLIPITVNSDTKESMINTFQD